MAARAKFQQSFNIKVTHDEKEGQFYVSTMEGNVVLHYDQEDDGIWHFTQITVPTKLRNFRMTPRLIEYALETARKAGLHIRVSCPTVMSFIAHNNFYQALITA